MMLLYYILFVLLLSVKGHNHFFNISIGIVNTKTVVLCGLSVNIHSLFNPTQIVVCPYVSIEKENIQLVDMRLSKMTNMF